jgi:putative transposase
MQRELVDLGLACGRHRVARLMRTHGIRAKPARRFRGTTDSRHGWAVAPNHVGRQFSAAGPNALWMGDVTFIPTAESWAYLAVLLDAWSRRVVGWAVGPELRTALPLAALGRALRGRHPGPGLVHHSDRGSQYASAAYQAVLERHGLTSSMSRSGDCWDNAVVESFFHTLKVERVHERRYRTWDEVREDLEQYIEVFYNRRRRPSTLGQISPAMFELQSVA